MSILHIWTFSVFVFLKQTKQNIEIYTGFAKNVSSIKMTFCKEKLVYASPPFFLLTACTSFRKSLSGFYWEQMLCVHPGAFARAKMPLVVGAFMAMHTPGKRSCSWSLQLLLAWIEGKIELWPAHEINSSILCLSHVDQPSQEGDAALLFLCCQIQHWCQPGPAAALQ